VVTTNILGDVVQQVAGDAGADIEVVMPLGSDPHEFAPSTKQAEAMVDADLLVINGAHFEEGMESIIEQAEANDTPVFAVADHVELLPYAGPEDDEHADEEEEADHADEEEEEHAEDPHIWTDPARIAEALPALGDALAEVEGIDTAAVGEGIEAYAAELTQLDQEIESTLAGIPEESRVLVTNHEVFGYFADRYGFEVIGTVIPSGTTLAEPSSAELEDLAEAIREHGLPAIFGETTESTRLADALAASVGSEVSVVELYTESLGEEGSGAETYVGLMRTDAELIAGALAPT
jgi:zinc/manganese transport system substrate-binding protein